MKTFYFKVILSETKKEIVLRSVGQTYYHAKDKMRMYGEVIGTIPFGKVMAKRK